jgi:hypothetical protein
MRGGRRRSSHVVGDEARQAELGRGSDSHGLKAVVRARERLESDDRGVKYYYYYYNEHGCFSPASPLGGYARVRCPGCE